MNEDKIVNFSLPKMENSTPQAHGVYNYVGTAIKKEVTDEVYQVYDSRSTETNSQISVTAEKMVNTADGQTNSEICVLPFDKSGSSDDDCLIIDLENDQKRKVTKAPKKASFWDEANKTPEKALFAYYDLLKKAIQWSRRERKYKMLPGKNSEEFDTISHHYMQFLVLASAGEKNRCDSLASRGLQVLNSNFDSIFTNTMSGNLAFMEQAKQNPRRKSALKRYRELLRLAKFIYCHQVQLFSVDPAAAQPRPVLQPIVDDVEQIVVESFSDNIAGYVEPVKQPKFTTEQFDKENVGNDVAGYEKPVKKPKFKTDEFDKENLSTNVVQSWHQVWDPAEFLAQDPVQDPAQLPNPSHSLPTKRRPRKRKLNADDSKKFEDPQAFAFQDYLLLQQQANSASAPVDFNRAESNEFTLDDFLWAQQVSGADCPQQN